MGEDEAIRRSRVTQEEDELRRALSMSAEEDQRRKKDVQTSNETALFDDALNMYVLLSFWNCAHVPGPRTTGIVNRSSLNPSTCHGPSNNLSNHNTPATT